MEDADREFVVNLIHAQDFYGTSQQFNTIDEFCQYFFTNDMYYCYTFIAHNAKAIDAHFILKWFIDVREP